jgi:hypothetical protein
MRHSFLGTQLLKLTSDGFTTMLFPAANAGAIFFTAMSKGWLNGCHASVEERHTSNYSL